MFSPWRTHTACLEGRYFFAQGRAEALSRAHACYERALERDPGFALAHDSLAELHWYLGFFGNMVALQGILARHLARAARARAR